MLRTKFHQAVVLVIFVLAIPSLIETLTDNDSIPDTILISTRGADLDFGAQLPTSCGALAVSNLQLAQPNVTFASACGSPNLGQPCGTCSLSSQTSTFGKLASIRNDNNGQMNTSILNCGNVLSGTCEPLPNPPNPPGYAYGCVGAQTLLNPANGNPILCGNLSGIVNQNGGGGPPAD